MDTHSHFCQQRSDLPQYPMTCLAVVISAVVCSAEECGECACPEFLLSLAVYVLPRHCLSGYEKSTPRVDVCVHSEHPPQ